MAHVYYTCAIIIKMEGIEMKIEKMRQYAFKKINIIIEEIEKSFKEKYFRIDIIKILISTVMVVIFAKYIKQVEILNNGINILPNYLNIMILWYILTDLLIIVYLINIYSVRRKENEKIIKEMPESQNIKEIEIEFKKSGKTDQELLYLGEKCKNYLEQNNKEKMHIEKIISVIIPNVVTLLSGLLGGNLIYKALATEEGILFSSYAIVYIFFTLLLFTPTFIIVISNRKIKLYPEVYFRVKLTLMYIDNYFKKIKI